MPPFESSPSRILPCHSRPVLCCSTTLTCRSSRTCLLITPAHRRTGRPFCPIQAISRTRCAACCYVDAALSVVAFCLFDIVIYGPRQSISPCNVLGRDGRGRRLCHSLFLCRAGWRAQGAGSSPFLKVIILLPRRFPPIYNSAPHALGLRGRGKQYGRSRAQACCCQWACRPHHCYPSESGGGRCMVAYFAFSPRLSFLPPDFRL